MCALYAACDVVNIDLLLNAECGCGLGENTTSMDGRDMDRAKSITLLSSHYAESLTTTYPNALTRKTSVL